jgi:hypothetical protein
MNIKLKQCLPAQNTNLNIYYAIEAFVSRVLQIILKIYIERHSIFKFKVLSHKQQKRKVNILLGCKSVNAFVK